MKICEALRRSVRLELNHIYTEKPFEAPTGTDMGWFCREHALHVTALAELLGESAQLCRGDIIVRIPGEITVYTMGSGDDHAWCRVDGKAPVDASMTLRHLAPNETDVSAICPDRPEELAGFMLRYEQIWTRRPSIKEGKNAIKWTRLSCRKFRDNAVRLQLHALATCSGKS